jgi:hypothetical protein
MADRGAAIETRRLENMSRVVMKQVDRADAIMKNMNRLAHSVDESIKTIDLKDIWPAEVKDLSVFFNESAVVMSGFCNGCSG